MGKGSRLPPATAQQRELLARVSDPEHMLAVFQRELPALAAAEIRVTACSVKPSSWRKAVKGRSALVYTLEIEVGGEASREYLVLGMTPATPELPGDLSAGALPHPWRAPFARPAAYLAELQMGLLFFPLDPAMPGLAEITGRDGAVLLEAWLPECRAGARVAGMECELAHYKPFDRAVLRIQVTLLGPGIAESRRTAYAKFFADDHGAECFKGLAALWAATRDATCLRLPQPFGYDPERRMLVMSEATGGRDLSGWIKTIEQGEPLPDGIGPERLNRCMLVSARALRELQRSGVHPERRRTFQDELARMKRDSVLLLGEVRMTRPELADGAARLLARLEALAPRTEQLVPAHGAFRHKQMLGDDRALTVIDWDGLCLANPALDAAAFLGRLCREPLRRRGAAPELEQMAARFRRAFLDDQPEVAPDLDLYQGLEMTEQVLRSFRCPEFDQEGAEQIRSLAEAAGAMLDRVEAGRGFLPRARLLSRWLAHAAAALVFALVGSSARNLKGIGGEGP